VAPQLSSRQFLHAGVEGNQNAVPFHRLPEEQSVRPSSSQSSRSRGLVINGVHSDAKWCAVMRHAT